MATIVSILDDIKASSDPRAGLLDLARQTESAERYDDMCVVMKALVQFVKKGSGALSVEERNLLSVAYKNVVGARRASLRTLKEGYEGDAGIDLYTKQVRGELEKICDEILDVLNESLIKDDVKDESQVFYLKMGADYHRYLAECIPLDDAHAKNAHKFYKRAFEIAEKKLASTHPIRLGLALNYSVCLFEIVKDPTEACKLAKDAFDEAIAQLDKLEEADYKDSTLIMQLLRDNLTLWTADGDEQ